jgi:hypothetical protein
LELFATVDRSSWLVGIMRACAAPVTIKGFLTAADAIVVCKVCGAKEGVPCEGSNKGAELKPGYVHFGRRVKRLLLTARATQAQRTAFEKKAVKMLIDSMK